MNKTHNGSVIALFSVQLQQLFSYVKGIFVTNNLSLLLVDRYILTIQQTVAYKEHFDTTFDLQRPSELSQILWHHGHNNKTGSKSFSLRNSSQKSPFFAVLINFKWEYQQYGHYFQTIFPFVMIMLRQKELKMFFITWKKSWIYFFIQAGSLSPKKTVSWGIKSHSTLIIVLSKI